jgi:hypothetical protein
MAAATELENGVENLWKSGMKGVRRNYPDFGCFMSINEMQAFCSAPPYAWADEKYWYLPDRDTPWEMFLPCVYEFNDNRKWIVTSLMVMLDESPKKYFNESSHLPGNSPITEHAAEVLHQVEGAEIPEGGWVGGDAWFESVLSAVEVMVRFNVFSTWVIQQNTDFFPMHALHSVLTARYSKRPTGHWVVFQTTISGVKVLAVCYAWSNSSTTYFASTYGSTNPAKSSYFTHFEDEFGTVGVKHIPQPSIKEWFYDFLDEHNKQRHSLLCIEKNGQQKICWFCLLVTLVGMSVVDCYRIYLNHDKQKYEKMDIVQFADELSLQL